jgi:hypothetical protein
MRSFEVGQDFRECLLEMRSLVASVGEELLQERIHSEQGGKQQNAAVTVLDIGGMNDGMEQQTQRVYENMASFRGGGQYPGRSVSGERRAPEAVVNA